MANTETREMVTCAVAYFQRSEFTLGGAWWLYDESDRMLGPVRAVPTSLDFLHTERTGNRYHVAFDPDDVTYVDAHRAPSRSYYMPED